MMSGPAWPLDRPPRHRASRVGMTRIKLERMRGLNGCLVSPAPLLTVPS